jgi:dTMP kinase
MGRLIVIEGLDGSGKSTQAQLLTDRLRAAGKRVRLLSFPRYESESSALVRLYLNGGLGSSPDSANAYAASLFFAADRYVTYVTDWKKDHLDPETVLIANRYTTANACHQLPKLPREEWDGFLSWLSDLEFCRLGLPRPDAVVALSMEPEISHRLIVARSEKTGAAQDIHEADAAYLRRCYDAMHYAADALGWITLDCTDGKDPYLIPEVERRVFEALEPLGLWE